MSFIDKNYDFRNKHGQIQELAAIYHANNDKERMFNSNASIQAKRKLKK
jgi:hypothetical protein